LARGNQFPKRLLARPMVTHLVARLKIKVNFLPFYFADHLAMWGRRQTERTGGKVGCRLMAARINMLIKTGNWKSSTDRDK